MSTAVPVAAVVPFYNGRDFVRAAIESILGQEAPPAEIVVVDDGSTDGGADLVAGLPGVRVVRQANGGEAAARNRGIRETTAPLLAFLDQDDLWLPRKLALQVAALAADPGLDFVFAQHRIFAEEGARWFRRDALDRVLTAELPGTLLVRRSAFDRIGLFREALRLGSDVDWVLRARDAGLRSRPVEEVLLLRRMHVANSSIDESRFMAGLLDAARASVRRKRSS
ncbi:MAG: glycosyltransferase family A protein [Dongiaceae bacterium]